MKFLQDYYHESANQFISVGADQGSAFAKSVAGDFNPIHDAESKRFCVPGDLLFAIALERYGLHEKMEFGFLDLLAADKPVVYPAVDLSTDSAQLEIVNEKDKPVVSIAWSGGLTLEAAKVEQMLRNYVAFSGQNFPHILVPLMEQHQVMINPKRPLVIYESMAFEFSTLEFEDLEIRLHDTRLEVDGRRGNAELLFELSSDGVNIGSGVKKLVLSGLRDYDQHAIQQMCDEYFASKDNYQAAES
ncbi:MAG: DUF3581 family protein [Pseudomonadota bacterium]